MGNTWLPGMSQAHTRTTCLAQSQQVPTGMDQGCRLKKARSSAWLEVTSGVPWEHGWRGVGGDVEGPNLENNADPNYGQRRAAQGMIPGWAVGGGHQLPGCPHRQVFGFFWKPGWTDLFRDHADDEITAGKRKAFLCEKG